jgi:hypothetical protein
MRSRGRGMTWLSLGLLTLCWVPAGTAFRGPPSPSVRPPIGRGRDGRVWSAPEVQDVEDELGSSPPLDATVRGPVGGEFHICYGL